ncbi:hypothetical protein AB835_03920 [Candidatus Endobugula sertula]|uniref:DNA primase n=1 Tax=Candidatus Endobugula sertula TaxID=62101 RepID=A0A1D2QS10_9GAMM|nr:hypothetical protein AB835_03920 [Candidatus Endobugula sertula]
MDVNEYAQATLGSMPSAALKHPCSSQVNTAQKRLGLVIRKAEFMGKGKAPERQLTIDSAIAEQVEDVSVDDKAIVTPESSPFTAPVHPAPTALEHPCSSASSLPEPTVATPLPEAPKTIDAVVNDQEIIIEQGDRKYRVRGLQKNMSYEQLKVNLLVSRGEHVHIDTFDLYSSRPRQTFINQASSELGVQDDVIKKDLGKVLLKLEELQEKQIKNTLAPEKEAPSLSDNEQQQAIELLKDKDLLNRILDDFKTAGLVGEETNKLVGYLSCVSRKLDKPLAVIIQSSSATGKSSLMDAILNFIPEEERVQYSTMTGQSLFYMG